MRYLGEYGRQTIAKFPLDASLSEARHRLMGAASVLSCSPWTPDPVEGPSALLFLLEALMDHEVAQTLHGRSEASYVAEDLSQLSRIVRSSRTKDLKQFRFLAQLVIDEASDMEIWEEVLRLINVVPNTVSTVVEPTSALDNENSAKGSILSTRWKELRIRAIADKVSIADVVERKEYFYPFEPAAASVRICGWYREREVFKQALLRDLDRLFIRLVDHGDAHQAYHQFAANIKNAEPGLELLEFEMLLFAALSTTNIDLSDFEVLRGLAAWKRAYQIDEPP